MLDAIIALSHDSGPKWSVATKGQKVQFSIKLILFGIWKVNCQTFLEQHFITIWAWIILKYSLIYYQIAQTLAEFPFRYCSVFRNSKFFPNVMLMLAYYFKRNILTSPISKIGCIWVVLEGRENTDYGLFDYPE